MSDEHVFPKCSDRAGLFLQTTILYERTKRYPHPVIKKGNSSPPRLGISAKNPTIWLTSYPFHLQSSATEQLILTITRKEKGLSTDMPTVRVHSQKRTRDIFNLVCYFLKGENMTLRHHVFETEN